METLDVIEDQDEYSNVFDERALPQSTVYGGTQTVSMANKLAKCIDRNRLFQDKRRSDPATLDKRTPNSDSF